MTKKLAVLPPILILLAVFIAYWPAGENSSASTRPSFTGLQPVYMTAAAHATSEEVSSLAAKTAKFQMPSQPEVRTVSDSMISRLRAENAPHEADGAPANISGIPMPAPSLSFEGIINRNNGEAYGLVFVPSDTNGDAGLNHYVQVTNALVRIYDKNGTPVTPPFKQSDLFAPLGTPCAARNDGSPTVLYDTLADRWLLTQYCTAFPPFRQMVAISRSGDPTGAWNLYEFIMPNNRLNDYAKFGVWPNAYYMTTDEFVGSDYLGSGAFAFNREKMLAGDPGAGYVYFYLPSTNVNRTGGLLPADLDGYTPPLSTTSGIFAGYISNDYGDPIDAIRLFELNPNFANPLSSTFTERPESPIEVAVFDPTSPPNRADIAQPAPGDFIDSQSDRLMYRVAYRNLGARESLVFNQTVRVTPLDQPYRAGVRVYEFSRPPSGGPFAVREHTTLGDGPHSRFMGGAAQDHQGNIAIEYSVSSATKMPSIYYTGKLASDPMGTFREERALVDGTGVQTAFGFRWGNYTGMTVDPADDCTFWMTNQYYTAESQAESPFAWLTRIGKFKFDECTAAPRAGITGTVTDAVTGLPIEGAVITASAYSRHTNAAGSYGTMLVDPRTYVVSASARGYGPQTFTVIAGNGQTVTQNFQLQPAPIMENAGTALTAESCTPNQVPDPGEDVTINVTLRNTGATAAQNLNAELVATGGVTNPGPIQNYGAIPANGPGVTRPFTFRVANSTPCGGLVTISLRLTDGSNFIGVVNIDLRLGVLRVAYSENFDRARRPALPAGWTSSATGAQQLWSTSGARNQSAPNSLFSPAPNQVGLNEVTSPSIAITSPNAKVSFRNWYELETTFLRNRLYDGSVMEIKIGSGNWQDILTAGGSFETGGYDGTIDSCCLNPLGGRQGWSGRSGINQVSEFITTSAKLPPAASGQNIALRWRIGTDTGTFREGQYIDDLVVSDGYACACGGNPIPPPRFTPFDFDGDNKTDISLFRMSDVPGAFDFFIKRSLGGFRDVSWGSTGDRPAPADFDGDLKSDITVFRPSEGNWYALRSSDNSVLALHFGLAGDKPVPADYDGDGKADIAVFRPSEGNWYYLRSSNGDFVGQHFGVSEDLPVPHDYDGDGQVDIAVFRPSEGNWYVLASQIGFFARHFGMAGDIPVHGDYDGDGKSDLVVFRPSDRTWYLQRSAQDFLAVPFGLSDDVPIQADFDGDLKNDIAVYRPSSDSWFWLRSSNSSFGSDVYGIPAGSPLPGVYVNP